MPEEIQKNETTNAVLKEKIEGLTKTTDIQFNSIRETLLDIKELMKGFATRLEVEEVKKEFLGAVKRIEDWQVNHEKDDKESFSTLGAGQKEVRDTILKWGAIAGVIFFILSFLSPVILKYFFKI